jgi:hypothetical protein
VKVLTKWFLVLLSALSLMIGCGSQSSTGGVHVSDGDGSMTLVEITMPSGTKCVAGVGMFKGALACNWPQTVVVRTVEGCQPEAR